MEKKFSFSASYAIGYKESLTTSNAFVFVFRCNKKKWFRFFLTNSDPFLKFSKKVATWDETYAAFFNYVTRLIHFLPQNIKPITFSF